MIELINDIFLYINKLKFIIIELMYMYVFFKNDIIWIVYI